MNKKNCVLLSRICSLYRNYKYPAFSYAVTLFYNYGFLYNICSRPRERYRERDNGRSGHDGSGRTGSDSSHAESFFYYDTSITIATTVATILSDCIHFQVRCLQFYNHVSVWMNVVAAMKKIWMEARTQVTHVVLGTRRWGQHLTDNLVVLALLRDMVLEVASPDRSLTGENGRGDVKENGRGNIRFEGWYVIEATNCFSGRNCL